VAAHVVIIPGANLPLIVSCGAGVLPVRYEVGEDNTWLEPRDNARTNCC